MSKNPEITKEDIYAYCLGDLAKPEVLSAQRRVEIEESERSNPEVAAHIEATRTFLQSQVAGSRVTGSVVVRHLYPSLAVLTPEEKTLLKQERKSNRDLAAYLARRAHANLFHFFQRLRRRSA